MMRVSCFKTFLFLQQSVAADQSHQQNICQLASASNNAASLPFENASNEKGGNLMMMRGMTAKDFDPIRYSGRWFEVASLKRGFAGQGQEDCHCTQVYVKINMVVILSKTFILEKSALHLGCVNFFP